MAGIGSPRQCRSGIDEADQPCHTGPAPVPRCARVGLDTGMNLAVRTGVGPVSSAVSCSRSSTASRFPRHPPAEPNIPGASALALRAPSDAPECEPHETSQSRRAEQQSRRPAVRRRHPMSDSDRHSHPVPGAGISAFLGRWSIDARAATERLESGCSSGDSCDCRSAQRLMVDAIDAAAPSPRSHHTPAITASASRATDASKCSFGACCEQAG
ncbi:hypothetical protein OKW30_001890 [Paraburkholderia sp. Clong3]